MAIPITDEEKILIEQALVELQLEHRDLDEIIHHLGKEAVIDDLKIKRLKKRKLHLKDQITRLEDRLIPDIIA